MAVDGQQHNADGAPVSLVPVAQVRVLAVGREEIVGRLRRCLRPWCVLTHRLSISEAMGLVQTRKCDVVVLDPSLLRPEQLLAVLNAGSDVGVGGVLYTAFDRQSVARVAKVVATLRCEVVGIGAENEIEILNHHLRDLGDISAPALVLGELAVPIAGVAVGRRRCDCGSV